MFDGITVKNDKKNSNVNDVVQRTAANETNDVSKCLYLAYYAFSARASFFDIECQGNVRLLKTAGSFA